jgi:hypothetical protein
MAFHPISGITSDPGSGVFPSLIYVQGNEQRSIVMNRTPFSVGRKVDKDLVIPDPRVSRDHALIVAENGDFFVVDHTDADLRRGVRTLSGGETFRASLALALALSEQLAGLSSSDGDPVTPHGSIRGFHNGDHVLVRSRYIVYAGIGHPACIIVTRGVGKISVELPVQKGAGIVSRHGHSGVWGNQGAMDPEKRHGSGIGSAANAPFDNFMHEGAGSVRINAAAKRGADENAAATAVRRRKRRRERFIASTFD